MAQFIAIAGKSFINRDHVVSIKYMGGGTWFVNTVDNKCHECNDEQAVRVLLYGDVKMAYEAIDAEAIANAGKPAEFDPDRRIQPTPQPVAQPQPLIDWVKRTQDALRAAFRCAAGTTDVFRIYRDVYATVHPSTMGYKVIIKDDFISGHGDLLGTVTVNTATGEKSASIKSTLTTGEKEAIDDMVAVLPE